MDEILLEVSGKVATVTLNRPEVLNACTHEMWRRLQAVFRDLADRKDARVVVVTGAGDAFCSGADVSGVGGEPRAHGLDAMRDVGDAALALHRLPQPTIAKVNGVAAGAGCNLALGCDLVVASDRARFSEIFARRALSIDFGGSWLLPRTVGLHRAKELAFFAEVIDAEEADRIGLVNRVVPADELDAFVADWAERLAAGPPIALASTKAMLNRSFESSMGEALIDEARSQTINFTTADIVEAGVAWREKRPADFGGQ